VTDLGSYSFLPWLRHGIANSVRGADLDRTNTRERVRVAVELQLTGEKVGGGGSLPPRTIPKDVEIFGPGDVVGLDARAIVRVEPREQVTAYEPNYMPHVEFYDEDLPWRYTPAEPDATRTRLRPWIALVVLADGEFQERTVRDAPLPAIAVLDRGALPEAADLWAWAHVHVNRDLAARAGDMTAADTAAVLARLTATLGEDPDRACSRIVCPRRLSANVGYTAFVVPTFESGRLAGLGLDPAGAPYATASAWEEYDGREQGDLLPVYHRWRFRTGEAQDFESLVRLLQPRPVDPRVGVRPLDVQRPGAGLPGILTPSLGGILQLGGALRIPDVALEPDELATRRAYEAWASSEGSAPHSFQRALARAVNLADDYQHEPAATANPASGVTLPEQGGDPVVTLPLYGRWHALQQRLLKERDGSDVPNWGNWVHELNLDPRHRTAAGFGTRVVQEHQETYMDAAWRQVGDVLAANAAIRRAQLAMHAATTLHRRSFVALASLEPGRALALTAPVQSRVLGDGGTIAHRRAQSMVPPALTSAPLRRALRSRGPLVRAAAERGGRPPRATTLLERVDKGEISAAPPKRTPPGVVTLDTLVRAFARDPRGKEAAGALSEKAMQPRMAKRLPEPGGFALRDPWDREKPPQEGHQTARRLKDAQDDVGVLVWASDEVAKEPERPQVDIWKTTEVVVSSLDPRVTIPRRTRRRIRFPRRIAVELDEQFQEAMAYPRIDLPMYEPLVRLSTDLFLPNIGLVEQNSVTLLETNQDFIEAYMVGLNHEMGRELLWREYPTDQRGSVFRQFWDVRGVLSDPRLTDEQRREMLYDIPKLHLWPRRSRLGDHDNRDSGRPPEEEAVLLIRGELLKRYPNAVIYAHKADWTRVNGRIDPTVERRLADLVGAEQERPPPAKVLTPLYEAKVDPDITFIGFDLTTAVAKGGDPTRDPNADAGWFFVVKERPGEPRFGLDLDGSRAVKVFNDLGWSNAVGVEEGEHLPASAFAPPYPLAALDLGVDGEKVAQQADDVQVAPVAASAARWAYILYQAPVMVAIHAAEMLRTRRRAGGA
jgi:hypothetical protein